MKSPDRSITRRFDQLIARSRAKEAQKVRQSWSADEAAEEDEQEQQQEPEPEMQTMQVAVKDQGPPDDEDDEEAFWKAQEEAGRQRLREAEAQYEAHAREDDAAPVTLQSGSQDGAVDDTEPLSPTSARTGDETATAVNSSSKQTQTSAPVASGAQPSAAATPVFESSGIGSTDIGGHRPANSGGIATISGSLLARLEDDLDEEWDNLLARLRARLLSSTAGGWDRERVRELEAVLDDEWDTLVAGIKSRCTTKGSQTTSANQRQPSLPGPARPAESKHKDQQNPELEALAKDLLQPLSLDRWAVSAAVATATVPVTAESRHPHQQQQQQHAHHEFLSSGHVAKLRQVMREEEAKRQLRMRLAGHSSPPPPEAAPSSPSSLTSPFSGQRFIATNQWVAPQPATQALGSSISPARPGRPTAVANAGQPPRSSAPPRSKPSPRPHASVSAARSQPVGLAHNIARVAAAAKPSSPASLIAPPREPRPLRAQPSLRSPSRRRSPSRVWLDFSTPAPGPNAVARTGSSSNSRTPAAAGSPMTTGHESVPGARPTMSPRTAVEIAAAIARASAKAAAAVNAQPTESAAGTRSRARLDRFVQTAERIVKSQASSPVQSPKTTLRARTDSSRQDRSNVSARPAEAAPAQTRWHVRKQELERSPQGTAVLLERARALLATGTPART